MVREPKPGSQTHTVLAYIRRHGSITAAEAVEGFRCYRLAARVKDLRNMGYDIVTHEEDHEGGRHARYVLRVSDMDLEGAGQIALFGEAA